MGWKTITASQEEIRLGKSPAALGVVAVYDLANDVWTRLEDRPDNQVIRPAIHVVGGRMIYFVNGILTTERGKPSAFVVEYFDLEKEEWIVDPTKPKPPPGVPGFITEKVFKQVRQN